MQFDRFSWIIAQTRIHFRHVLAAAEDKAYHFKSAMRLEINDHIYNHGYTPEEAYVFERAFRELCVYEIGGGGDVQDYTTYAEERA